MESNSEDEDDDEPHPVVEDLISEEPEHMQRMNENMSPMMMSLSQEDTMKYT